MEFGVCRNITQVRRNFRKQFFKSNPKAVAQRYEFQRILNRFDTKGVKSKERPCDPASIITDDLVEKVACARSRKVATFNTFSRKLKLGNMVMFSHF